MGVCVCNPDIFFCLQAKNLEKKFAYVCVFFGGAFMDHKWYSENMELTFNEILTNFIQNKNMKFDPVSDIYIAKTFYLLRSSIEGMLVIKYDIVGFIGLIGALTSLAS